MSIVELPTPITDSLPPHIAWFAPWRWLSHWRPWKRWTLFAGVLIAGYVLTPVPALWTVERLAGRNARETAAFTVYLPIVALCELVPTLDRHFYQLQDDWLRSLIGDP